MCGIAGLHSLKRNRASLQSTITQMTACLSHRGPDEEGYYVADRIALGHRRLSIIDLKTGHQPMFNEDDSACIVYNGEIYNFHDIKKELVQKGHVFRTSSDTETILHAYEEWGEECLQKLNGMFAFGIWDSRTETLFLARDRFGEKPLFYANRNGEFIFSSEMKSLLHNSWCDRTLNGEALSAYFTLGYIPAPLTIYESIHKLLPGHYLIYRNGRITTHRYWDLVFQPDRGKKEKDFIHELMHLLNDAVGSRLISDVPIGAFLSGGVDSSTVVALMSRAIKSPVNTFTIGFGGNVGGFDDERKYARFVAERYKTNHREFEVTPKVDTIIERIVRSFDEPFADDSTIPSYFVSQLARRHVTVALSGLGGDELFCGYERYLGFHMSQAYNKIPEVMREKIIKKFIGEIPESASGNCRVNHIKRFVRASTSDHAQRYFGFVSKLHPHYRNSFFASNGCNHADAFAAVEQRFVNTFNSAQAEDPLNKVFYCDIKTYLPDDILACTDRLSMHHSLEVRVPFLDHRLAEYCATIPPEMKVKWFTKKYLLKKSVSELLPKPVIDHKKQGFVGPLPRWLRTNLREMTENKLSKRKLKKHNLFNSKTVEKILSDHYEGRETNDTLIWSLLVFQTWFDLYMS